jgi:hypothetical protein
MRLHRPRGRAHGGSIPFLRSGSHILGILKAMHSHRRPTRPEEFTAPTAGDLTFGGTGLDAGGMQLLDHRSRGFAARILAKTGGQTNADYAFARVDESTTAFTSLVGADVRGDGVALYARERMGLTTVPTSGSTIVWLEPLAGGAGYGFLYGAAGATPPYGQAAGTPNLIVAMSAGVLSETGAQLSIPSVGEWEIGVRILYSLAITGGADGNIVSLAARLRDDTTPGDPSMLPSSTPFTWPVGNLERANAVAITQYIGGSTFPCRITTLTAITLKLLATASFSGGGTGFARIDSSWLAYKKLN